MIKITCLVENSARRGSPFWGEHGLSFLLETDEGRLLFDTGQSAAVLLHNLALVGASLGQLDGVALSHAHYDHTGGLAAVLAQRPGLPVYANPDLGRPRFSLKDGRPQFIGLPLTMTALAHLADVRLSAKPAELLPGLWTTGQINERSELEGRSTRHVVPDGDGWQPDPYQDDLSLVVETEAGLVVVCGCCHAGLLNTLAHVKQHFEPPIVAVMGGTHLESAKGEALERVVKVLTTTYNLHQLYPNHCSGERAYVALANAYGDRVRPCPAGTVLTFE